MKPAGSVKLRIVPCSNERAKEYVDAFHRHHRSSVSARFSVAVVDPVGLVRGVVMVGRPVARLLDDGWTLEVNRLATDGCPNACSLLYGAARRVARELGYAKLITYIREDEPGYSLRASGWEYEGPIRARSWDMPGRPRTDKTEIVRRGRWSVQLGAPTAVTWAPDRDGANRTSGGRSRDSMSELVERDCPLCQGRGWNEVTVAEHACGGDAERCAQMCPQPAQGQEECEFCLGTGKLTVGAAGGGAPSGPAWLPDTFIERAYRVAHDARRDWHTDHDVMISAFEASAIRRRVASRSAGSEEPQ